MTTGKSTDQVSRSAPDKARAVPLDTSEKPMPEFPMEKKELVYPGEGSPFPTASPSESSSGGPHQPGVPAHPAVPPTELPRNKIHLSAVESKPLLDILSHCIAACERCITGCEQALEPHK